MKTRTFTLALAAALALAVPAAYAGKGTNGLGCKTTAKSAVTMTHSTRWPGASSINPRGLVSVGKGQPTGSAKGCATRKPVVKKQQRQTVAQPAQPQPTIVNPTIVNPPLAPVPTCTPSESQLPNEWVYGGSDAALAEAVACTQEPAAVESQAQSTDNGAANADTAAQTTDNGAGNAEAPVAAPPEEVPYWQGG